MKRQADPKPYITAHFKELPPDFTLGDKKVYGDFENRPLQSGQEYIFFVLAVLENSENVSRASPTRWLFAVIYSDKRFSSDHKWGLCFAGRKVIFPPNCSEVSSCCSIRFRSKE